MFFFPWSKKESTKNNSADPWSEEEAWKETYRNAQAIDKKKPLGIGWEIYSNTFFLVLKSHNWLLNKSQSYQLVLVTFGSSKPTTIISITRVSAAIVVKVTSKLVAAAADDIISTSHFSSITTTKRLALPVK